MKQFLFAITILLTLEGSAQVYNFGANEITFKNLKEYGLTYRKTGDDFMDSLMITNLEKYWNFTEFHVLGKMERPEKTATLIFITTKELTKKHMMDRKNQHVLVILPAEGYVVHQQVTMETTLGYMYLNGFYDLVAENDEYRFMYMLFQSLNRGLSIIQNKRIIGEPEIINDQVAAEILGSDGPSVGNTLILNREQTRHVIQKEDLDKLGIRYRLYAEEEYYDAIAKKDPTQIILYFAVNRFTEVAMVRISDGELLYSKHYRDAVPSIDKKTLKLIAQYFQ